MRLTIDENLAGKRLDQALAQLFPDCSRARLQKYIRDGFCKIENAPALAPGARLRLGQKMEFEPPAAQSALEPEDGELNILYKDEDIAIINKAAGLTVHPCPSCSEKTLAHILLAHFPELGNLEGDRPGIVHRLDKDTSGLMVIALNERTRQKLVESFAAGQIHKEYLALVEGKPGSQGGCAESIGRHPAIKTRMAVVSESHGGKKAQTEWHKLWEAPDNSCALLQIRIHSGRTHQIRVHMAHCGFPLLGDQVYAPAKTRIRAERQMLHAWRLSFVHPRTGKKLDFLAPPPDDFYNCLFRQARQMRKIVVTGNQGCGKSEFCKQLAQLGLPLVSADEIVAQLYAQPGAVSDWLDFHGHKDALEANGSVNKRKLMALLQSSAVFRQDFDNFVHALVLDEIEKFWNNAKANGAACAVAEIPLYFEANGPARFGNDVTIIGINCPKAKRWKRIMANRGWSEEKTASLEKWQMPEENKMALCDEVIDNAGAPANLAIKAKQFYERLRLAENSETLSEGLLNKIAGK